MEDLVLIPGKVLIAIWIAVAMLTVAYLAAKAVKIKWRKK